VENILCGGIIVEHDPLSFPAKYKKVWSIPFLAVDNFPIHVYLSKRTFFFLLL
jgi:hypothetical protein